jgi:hypothetical protein
MAQQDVTELNKIEGYEGICGEKCSIIKTKKPPQGGLEKSHQNGLIP